MKEPETEVRRLKEKHPPSAYCRLPTSPVLDKAGSLRGGAMGRWLQTRDFWKPHESRGGRQLHVIAFELGQKLGQCGDRGWVGVADGQGRALLFQYAPELAELPKRIGHGLGVVQEHRTIK